MDTSTRFHVYRYQILPIQQHVQLSLLDQKDVLDIDELRRRKNEFFRDAIVSIQEYTNPRTAIIHQVLYESDDILIVRLGANRGVNITTKDFEERMIENWPTALVVFHNDPEVQKVAIEIEYKAFRKTSTLAAILTSNLNDFLKGYLLSVTLNPLFDQHQFWEVVKSYPGQISETEFEMISPNMANISESLKFDLSALHRNTNTQQTNLRLKSDKNSSLNLSQDDEFIASLVEYSSEGGGNITLKIKGVSRKITTSDSTSEVSIDEIETTIDDPKVLATMFRGILK